MKVNLTLKRIIPFFFILSTLISSPSSTFAQNVDAVSPQNTSANEMVVAQIYFSSTDDLTHLASYLDIWAVNHADGYLLAMLTTGQLTSLQRSGHRVIIDQPQTDSLNKPLTYLPGQDTNSIPSYPCYRTVEETYSSMQAIATNFPNLAELIPIGESWARVTQGEPAGYDILALRLTNESFGNITEKPTFFLMAEIHAREYVTAETAMRYGEYLINNYGTDPDITWLLDYFRVYIITMTNPDGRKLAENGKYWRKNVDNNDGCTDPNLWGTDLNRNFSYKWNDNLGDTDPCTETYKGHTAASEPEVQAIASFAQSVLPDQNGGGIAAPETANGLFISLHSFGQYVMWPWAYTSTPSPNNSQLQTLGRHLAYFNNYTPQQSWYLYPTIGTTDEFIYSTLGVATYTFEMDPQWPGPYKDFFLACDIFQSSVYPKNLDSLLYAFKTARQPYINPGGPDTLNITVDQTSVFAGIPIQLTASANDTRYKTKVGDPPEPIQNIKAARYSFDNPSWISGTTPHPMTATDGNFNNNLENIQATIDTTGLAPGQHIIFVESQDTGNRWGVASAIFINIIDTLKVFLPVTIK